MDSVTGELTTRLGAVGGVAGEAVRRSVRDAAGGAQTIALLVEADAAGARHAEPADIAAPAAPGPAAPGVPGSAEIPAPAEHPAGTGAVDPYMAGDRPAPDAPSDSPAPAASADPGGDRPGPDPAAKPPAAAGKHQDPPTAPAPVPPGNAADPPGHAQHPAAPAPSADAPARTAVALPPMDPVADASSVAAGHTPWTPGAGTETGTEQATGHTPGSTPWNSGAGSSMPYPPGMPGGLGSLTPQERPPRGSAPWSRGRENKDGTVFPRPRGRPDQPASTNRTEWAPP
ncbi:hypothetical protein [Nocardia jinanensis]|uniref:hypothetical protein n=1 Tax=Nocardia jinanensis TaxID=382504 RepID=UPI0016628D51|nr:hypothetical protein [Nocardia jinanensis]